MYIRRKVFSVAEDMYGDERYFSTTDIDLGFSDYDDNFYDERDFSDYYDYDYDDLFDERIYTELITDKKTGKQFISRDGELIPLESVEIGKINGKEAAAWDKAYKNSEKANAKYADYTYGNKVVKQSKKKIRSAKEQAADVRKKYNAVQAAKKKGESFISGDLEMKRDFLKRHKELKNSLANEIAGRAADKAAAAEALEKQRAAAAEALAAEKAAAAEAFKKQASINSGRMAKQIAANRKLRKLGIAGAIGAGVIGTGAGYFAGRNSK